MSVVDAHSRLAEGQFNRDAPSTLADRMWPLPWSANRCASSMASSRACVAGACATGRARTTASSAAAVLPSVRANAPAVSRPVPPPWHSRCTIPMLEHICSVSALARPCACDSRSMRKIFGDGQEESRSAAPRHAPVSTPPQRDRAPLALRARSCSSLATSTLVRALACLTFQQNKLLVQIACPVNQSQAHLNRSFNSRVLLVAACKQKPVDWVAETTLLLERLERLQRLQRGAAHGLRKRQSPPQTKQRAGASRVRPTWLRCSSGWQRTAPPSHSFVPPRWAARATGSWRPRALLPATWQCACRLR